MMKFPSIEELKHQHFTHLEADAKKPLYESVKRFLDIVLSLLGLVCFLPFWLLIVVLIHLDSPGKALFSHVRIGKDRKHFKLYKFRTMFQGVKDQELAPQTPRDERVTRIGRFLRRTSLDEVPQLINVLKGDMSLVGPRPEMPFMVEHYTPLERKRLLVKPGAHRDMADQRAKRPSAPSQPRVRFLLHQAPFPPHGFCDYGQNRRCGNIWERRILIQGYRLPQCCKQKNNNGTTRP